MQTKARKGLGGVSIAIVLILFIGVIVLAAPQLGWTLPGSVPSGPGSTANCPDTGSSSLKLQVFNKLNTSTTESQDVTIVCTGSDGSTYTITDTTAPTATSVNCGYDYTCKAVSSSSENGDHGKLIGLRSGPSSAVVSDGILTFTADAPNVNIDLDSTQHSRTEIRVYDNDAASFVYAESDSTKGEWETTGSKFGSSTANQSNSGAIAVGSGGKMDITIDVRAAQQGHQVEDFGLYIFIDAASATWDTPSIKLNGVTRVSDCGALTSDEAKKYSGEEYCYKITGVPITNNDYATIDAVFSAITGVNPSTQHINMTIVSIGSFTSTTDSTNVLRGAVKDDSSQTVVLNQEEYQFTIS